MYRKAVGRQQHSFDGAESHSLRAVYLLAVSALSCTRHVDDSVIRLLADAVLESYVHASRPRLPLSEQETEDMAIMSIELLVTSHPDVLLKIH